MPGQEGRERLPRRARALLGRVVGSARAGGPPAEPEEVPSGRPVNLKRRVEVLEERNAALRRQLAAEGGRDPAGVVPENVVWIFGAGRTGSSWLTFMMGALPDHTRWNEPLVGNLFGHLYNERGAHRQDKEHFILANEHRHVWLGCLRDLVLMGGASRFPERISGGYLVVKEPHGSLGTPLLMEALPESRMIFLVRDPRDVVASAAAASYIPGPRDQRARRQRVEETPVEFASLRARSYLRDIRITASAFAAHAGRKAAVRYEDLRADTLGEMKRIYSELEIPVDAEDLARVVAARAWENVPDEMKGGDKRRRKATPGGWRDDLTPEQVEEVERITAPLLEEYYRA